MAVSDTEYAKADLCPSYAPAEYKVGEMQSKYESDALQALARGIRRGDFPRGSMIVEKR